MRSIFFGIIVLFASTAAAHPAQAEKHRYVQARTGHWHPYRQAQIS
jgi:hypothetical protein